TACGLQAEKTGRFSLHWRDNTRPDKRSAIRNKCQVLHAEVAWWNQRGKGVELLHHLFPEQHNNNPRFETSALF
ncbi:hypothetical protein, partial [Escherichia coli]|uniref:hypothetical protein n=1 Tax=Escherichia coli TaxID=562 RepID=UPI00313E1176